MDRPYLLTFKFRIPHLFDLAYDQLIKKLKSKLHQFYRQPLRHFQFRNPYRILSFMSIDIYHEISTLLVFLSLNFQVQLMSLPH